MKHDSHGESGVLHGVAVCCRALLSIDRADLIQFQYNHGIEGVALCCSVL